MTPFEEAALALEVAVGLYCCPVCTERLHGPLMALAGARHKLWADEFGLSHQGNQP